MTPTPTPAPTATATPCSGSNDFFECAAEVGPLPFSASQQTASATRSSDDPTPSCGVDKSAHSVWYRFTPASSFDVTVDSSGSNYDTVIAVWTGARGSLTEVTCSDDVAGTAQSKVVFKAQPGITYFIEFAAPNGAPSGELQMFVNASCDGHDATIVGSEKSDVITGTSGPDVIHGLGGDDTISGGGGDDIICGGSGNDVLRGDGGNDTLIGGPGDDDLEDDSGTNRLAGGSGTDTCVGTSADTIVNCE